MTDREYYDRFARHIIDTEFYAQAWEEKAKRRLERLRKKLGETLDDYGIINSRAKYERLKKEVDGEVDEEVDALTDDLKKDEEEQRKKEIDWLGIILKAFIGITVAMAIMKGKKLKSQPFGKYEDLDDFGESLKEKVRKTVTVPAMSSYMFGSGLKTVSEEMDRRFDKIERDAMSDIHLSITENQRNTQRLLLEDKSGFEYLYVAMLDSKTCAVCGGYSGNVYKDLSEAPTLPVHHLCRCYYLPVKKGQEYDRESYSEWFDRQPDSVKYKILGPFRYGFYKSGMKFSEFTSKGRKLTLKELFNQESDVP